MGLTEKLGKLFRSRYVLYLEAEIERMRQREAALVDGLLNQANLPSITPREKKPTKPVQGHILPSQMRAKFEAADRQTEEKN